MSLSFPPVRALGRGAGWYRGDCHVHSVHSDGELAPEELALRARVAGLDFIATTEHNSAAAPDVWAHLAADDFLIVLGEEVTTKTGHWLALGTSPGQVVDWNHQVRDGLIDRCLDQVHQVGGLCVAAHPHAPYPSGDFMFPFRGFDVVEVWNGLWTSDRPWNADNEAALAEWGRSLAADIQTGSWRPHDGQQRHTPGGADRHPAHRGFLRGAEYPGDPRRDPLRPQLDRRVGGGGSVVHRQR